MARDASGENTVVDGGTSIVLTDASHYLQFDRPDVVISAVADVVTAVRTAAVN